MKTNLSLGLIVLSSLFVFSMTAIAQDAAPVPPVPQASSAPEQPAAPAAAKSNVSRLSLEQAERDRPTMKDMKIEKKISGRLPNGYRNVVTSVQRTDIYKIQIEYNEVIELLKLRIEMLEQERDRRVDGLLSEEQVQKLRQVRGALESEKQQVQAGTGRTRRER